MSKPRKPTTPTNQQGNCAKMRKAIRAALIEGEKSGEPQPFDGNQFKQEMAAKYADTIRLRE